MPTDAVISGLGQSQVGRRLGRSAIELTVEATERALADSGLSTADIDGVSTWPGKVTLSPGFSDVGVDDLQEAMRFDLDWFSGGPEAPGQLGAVINAVAAVGAGLARHVLCFRTVTETSPLPSADGSRRGKPSVTGTGPRRIPPGFVHWLAPFGAVSAAQWVALYARRHMHEFGTTREQLGAIALNARANAGRNPAAVYRDPLTMDDYLGARMISDPLGLYDCDVPCDGSTVVIVSHRDAAQDLAAKPVHIEAVGCARHRRPSWIDGGDFTSMAARDAAAMLWRRTTLTPDDVDVAELYDGFSMLTLLWLEALGFCARGESGPFVQGGARIALDGDLPLNTQGGQLSAGRLHGFGFLHEAAVQLRGEGRERQVPGDPRAAVAAAGGGPLGGCILLTAEPCEGAK